MYLAGSVILIIAAIAVTTVVNRFQPSDSSGDIRTKAGTSNSLQFTGIISTVDENKGIFTVDNLQFAYKSTADNASLLGSWTVTPSPGVNLTSILPGTKIAITVVPSTFLIRTHTVTATQITILR